MYLKRYALTGVALCAVGLLFQNCKKNDSTSKPALNGKHNAQEVLGSRSIDDGTYQFITTNSTPSIIRSVGVADSSSAAGAKIVQNKYANNTGQDWTLTYLGDGDYSIINANSGLALDIPNTTTVPVQLKQSTPNSGNSQRWKIVQQGNYQGYKLYRIISKVNTNVGVSMAADTTSGAKVNLNILSTAGRGSYFIINRVAYKDKLAEKFFLRRSGWDGGDGGYTVPLADGRVLWTFGDSFLDNYDPATGTIFCVPSVNNAGILQQPNNWDWRTAPTLLDASTPTNPSPWKTVVSHDMYWNWPVSGVQLGDTVYVYGASLERVNGYQGTGFDDLFKMKYPEMSLQGFRKLPSLNGIQFGIGFVKDEAAGYVYVYGNKRIFIESGVYVGRFPINNINAPWEFWNGTAWVGDVTQAAIIGTGAATSENVCKVKDKYILVSSEITFQCDNGKNIYTATSSSPTGPFNTRKSIYVVDDKNQGHSPLFYVPVCHPELLNERNELLITYAVSGYAPCVPDCTNLRRVQKNNTLKAIRVPLKMIDPAL